MNNLEATTIRSYPTIRPDTLEKLVAMVLPDEIKEGTSQFKIGQEALKRKIAELLLLDLRVHVHPSPIMELYKDLTR